jgi:PilZ domain
VPSGNKLTAAPGFQERGGLRKRVLFGGKIVYGEDGAFTVDCVIKDVSDTGARISLGQRISIPSAIHFIDLKAGFAYEAQVAWRRAPNFGLHFLKTIDLKTVDVAHASDALVHLVRLWNASSARQ